MPDRSSQLGLSDEQMLRFAKRALSSPAAAFGAMASALQDGAKSLGDLGMTPQALERLASSESDSEDRDQIERFAKSAMFNGDESLNVAMALALEKRAEATAKKKGYRSGHENITLDFMDLRYLLERPDPIVTVWMSCLACSMLHQEAIEAAIERPDCFETPGGVSRVQDALGEANRVENGKTFWLSAGPMAFEGALSRALEDGLWDTLSEACSYLRPPASEGDLAGVGSESGADAQLREARLTRVGETLGGLYKLRPDAPAGLGLLAELASWEQWPAIEAFAKAGEWGSKPASLKQLSDGIAFPDRAYVRALEPHESVKGSELYERPIGLSDLGALWELAPLRAMGERLGEDASRSLIFAQALRRYDEARALGKKDKAAGEALAQSAELLWVSRSAAPAALASARASLAI